VYALVLVRDVEGVAFGGDGYLLDARQAGELADELGFEEARAGVLGQDAAEVGSHGPPATGVILDQDALLVTAVDVARYEV
jgi:hypothetical protein